MRLSRSHGTDLILLLALKACVSAFVLRSGFVAISDDDFSRIVIAQGFAEGPKADPSGTSWLPLPFWIFGSAFALFGSELATARAVALALGLVSVVLAWLAARVLGASRSGALLGAAIAGLFPYSAWLGVAAVPEALTAGLTVFGAAALSSTAPRVRLAAGLCFAFACFSRYEPWPAALVFALVSFVQARSRQSLPVALGGLLALAAPLLWILHGVFVHGDALFFVARVTAYRDALGLPASSVLERAAFYPLALVRAEPELFALTVVALVTARVTRQPLARYRAPLLCFGAMLLFLIAGSVRGGAPTHHAERALLAPWFGMALLSGDVLARAFAELKSRGRALLVAAVALEGVGASLLRPHVTEREPFITRETEIDIGREARLLGAERLLVASDDYGYFAVIAAFGSPSRAAPLVDRDPRQAAQPDPFTEPNRVLDALQRAQAGWLVAPRRHEGALKELGRIAARNEGFLLMEAKR